MKKANSRTSEPLSREENALVDSLLDGIKDLPPETITKKLTNPRLASALVEKLPINDVVVPLLGALQQAFREKGVQKAIRKAIFKLKQRGISISEIESKADSSPLVLREGQKDEPFAYLSSIDGSGCRLAFLALPRAPIGFDVGMGMVCYETGVVDFQFAALSKKRTKEIKDRFHKSSGPLPVISVSVSHAAAVLEEAYNISIEGAAEVPSTFLSFRSSLPKDVSPLERPAIYSHITHEEIHGEVLGKSEIEKLFGHDLLKDWSLPPQEMRPMVEEFVEAEESPLELMEYQKMERTRESKAKWLEKFYPQSRREKLARRFEEMAYVFWAKSEPDYARLSLKACQNLREEGDFPDINPVLDFLIEHTVDILVEAGEAEGETEEPEDESPSLIIRP